MKTKGLTLAEAHKSGRNYRRPNWLEYSKFYGGNIPLIDAIATDYELEPQAKLLTREEVRQAALTVLILPHHSGATQGFHQAEMICNNLFGPEEDV